MNERRHYSNYSPVQDVAALEARIEEMKRKPISEVRGLIHHPDKLERNAARAALVYLHLVRNDITTLIQGGRK